MRTIAKLLARAKSFRISWSFWIELAIISGGGFGIVGWLGLVLLSFGDSIEAIIAVLVFLIYVGEWVW